MRPLYEKYDREPDHLRESSGNFNESKSQIHNSVGPPVFEAVFSYYPGIAK